MPRSARALVGGLGYHMLNRGNARMPVFHEDGDYDAFVTLLAQAQELLPMRRCVAKGTPLGIQPWVTRTAKRWWI